MTGKSTPQTEDDKFDEDIEVQDFSAIRFWELLSTHIPKKTSGALGQEFIHVQHDAYARLASSSPDESEDEIFAVYDYNRKERDSALRFVIRFGSHGFTIEMEGVGTFGNYYIVAFPDEDVAAKQIIATIMMLANGQLSALVSMRHGEVCASELLLRKSVTSTPVIIATQGSYRWWWTSNEQDVHSYTSQLLSNTNDAQTVTVPKEYFLCDYAPDGTIQARGRTLTELTPLTKADHQYVISELIMRDSGKEPKQSDWGLFYASWEFWLGVVTFIGAIYYGNSRGFVPQFVIDYPYVTWPISIALCYLLLVPLLQRKEHLKQVRPDHPWIRFDDWLRRFAVPIGLSLIALTCLASNFGPVYAPIGSPALYSLTYFFATHAAWVIAIITLYAISAILPWLRRSYSLMASALTMLAASVIMWVFNFTQTNTDVEGIEPYTTLIVLSSFVAMFIGVAVLVSVIKSYRARRTTPSQHPLWRRLAWPMAVIGGYLSAGMLLYGAWLVRQNLTPDMVQFGGTILIWGAIAVAGLVASVLAILISLKRYSLAWLSTLFSITFFTPLVVLGFFTTDKVNDMSGLTWLMCFGGAFASLLCALPLSIAHGLDSKGTLEARNFGTIKDEL